MDAGISKRLGRVFGNLRSLGSKLAGVLVAVVALTSCGEKKAEHVAQEESREEVQPDLFANMAMDLLAQELFQYQGGFLPGNDPPAGFEGQWLSDDEKKAAVEDGVLILRESQRVWCFMDTSTSGVFARYLDTRGAIGRDGLVLYISYFQQHLVSKMKSVSLAEFSRGKGPVEKGKIQWSLGIHAYPIPVGHFGLRVKKDYKLSVRAPQLVNRRENLIVLRLTFGNGGKDEIACYDNPLPDGEDEPVGVIESYDLAFDRIGFACFQNGAMKIRNLRFADNFFSVAVDH